MAGEGDFVFWEKDRRADYCVLGFLEGFEDDWKLVRGMPLAEEWPHGVQLGMDPDFNRQIKLSDHLDNPNEVIVASPALRAFLEERDVPGLEFLPVEIINHKNKLASDEFTIVNLLAAPDCLDIEASHVTWNDILPEYVSDVEQIILNANRIDPDVGLFRARTFARPIFVRRDLADAILDAGLTGIRFFELEDWE